MNFDSGSCSGTVLDLLVTQSVHKQEKTVMHLTTKSVNSQVTTQLTDLTRSWAFCFWHNELVFRPSWEEAAQLPQTHENDSLHTNGCASKIFSFSFPFLSFEKEFSLREIST